MYELIYATRQGTLLTRLASDATKAVHVASDMILSVGVMRDGDTLVFRQKDEKPVPAAVSRGKARVAMRGRPIRRPAQRMPTKRPRSRQGCRTNSAKRPMPMPKKPREPRVIATLNREQLETLRRCAAAGVSLDVSAGVMKMPVSQLGDILHVDKQARSIWIESRAAAVLEVAESLRASAVSGRDSGAARFFLERIGGEQWRPPRTAVAIAVVPEPLDVEKDRLALEAVETRLQRQKLLVAPVRRDDDDLG